MIKLTPRLWAGLGLMVAVAGVGACAPDASDSDAAGTGPGNAMTTGGEAGEGGEGGEGGEAGANMAYASVPEASRLGLRIAHLGGFLRIAEAVAANGDTGAAGILVEQGLLEVHGANADAYAVGKAAAIKPAYDALVIALNGDDADAVRTAFAEAKAAEAAAMLESGANPADVVRGMVSIAAGLYGLAVTDQGTDPVEYQHSMGAALVARDVFEAGRPALTGENNGATGEAANALGALLTLYPGAAMPEAPAPAADVSAAAARVELALSGL